MYDQDRLKITGHEDRLVPNRFFRQREALGRLAILLPGYAYTVEMPLLYYPTGLFLENRFDVLHVRYAYHHEASFRMPLGSAERRWLSADVRAAVGTALAQRDYLEVVVLGRSLGTLAMAYLLGEELPAPATRWIWMSPLFKDPWLSEKIERHAPRSLFLIGTADPHYESPTREQIRRAVPHEWLVLEDAGHGLEIPGDIRRTLQALEEVVCAIARFSGCAGCEGKEEDGSASF